MNRLAGFALAVGLLASCGRAAPQTPTATTAPSPSPSPTRTAAPTPTRTASPTAAPTPTPAPTPAPTVNGDAARLEFARHVIEQLTLLSENSDDVIAYIQAGDAVNLRRAVDRGVEFLDAEIDYLREHPAAACFADAETQWRLAITKYADAYAAIQSGLQSPIDTDAVSRGLVLLDEGTQLMDGIANAVISSDCG